MKISVVSASELDAGLIERWKQIQSSDVSLRSPYYSPEFTRMVAGSGQAVRVAIIESEGIIAGFFPHQQASFGRLKNVGGGHNDYHGLIALPSLDVQASALLKACKGTYLVRGDGFVHSPHGPAGALGRLAGCGARRREWRGRQRVLPSEPVHWWRPQF